MARQTGLGRGLGSLISGGVAVKKAAGKKRPSKKAAAGKGGKGSGKAKKSRSPEKTVEGTGKASIPEGTRPFAEHSQEGKGAGQPATGLLEIPTGKIVPNPHQPRREFREESLKELAESIRAEGLLQPVVVRKRDDIFELVAGERRWRACQQLKLKSVPARVIEASETSSAVLSLIENLQREDLNPIEEAMGYASLLKDFDLKQEQVAERVGRSRAAVANALRLLGLAREIQGYLIKGHLSVGHAKVLLGVEDADNRLLLARQAIERGWSVRELERRMETVRKPGEGKSRPRSVNPAEEAAITEVQNQLSSAFSTRVYLKHAPKKGRIVIEYYGNEDLQRIMERMGLQ